jgi:hypothetical protein
MDYLDPSKNTTNDGHLINLDSRISPFYWEIATLVNVSDRSSTPITKLENFMKDHLNLMSYFPRSLYEIKLKSMKSLMSRTEIQISPTSEYLDCHTMDAYAVQQFMMPKFFVAYS